MSGTHVCKHTKSSVSNLYYFKSLPLNMPEIPGLAVVNWLLIYLKEPRAYYSR